MKIPIYQVDAFTNALFGGNPAAVCPLDCWLDENLMQQIATENNLAETAFFVPVENAFEIRWFTPEAEVDLCGHATLASAHVLFNHLHYTKEKILFHSRNSGTLGVKKEGEYLQLDFPADQPKKTKNIPDLEIAFGEKPMVTFEGRDDYLLIYETEQQIKSFSPDFERLKTIKKRGVIVSAKGDKDDFVSRFFAPGIGIPEDPVTGSAHTLLTPYWSEKLGKNKLTARQLSKRGGALNCELKKDRVLISGKAVTYLIGAVLL